MGGKDDRNTRSQDRTTRADEGGGRIDWLELGTRAILLVAAVLMLRSMFQAEEAVSAIQDGVVTIILVQSMLMLRFSPRPGRLESLKRDETR